MLVIAFAGIVALFSHMPHAAEAEAVSSVERLNYVTDDYGNCFVEKHYSRNTELVVIPCKNMPEARP